MGNTSKISFRLRIGFNHWLVAIGFITLSNSFFKYFNFPTTFSLTYCTLLSDGTKKADGEAWWSLLKIKSCLSSGTLSL